MKEKAKENVMKLIIVIPLGLLLAVGVAHLIEGLIGGGLILIGFFAFVVWMTWEPAIKPILFGFNKTEE